LIRFPGLAAQNQELSVPGIINFKRNRIDGMDTNIQINPATQVTQPDPDFIPIDGPILHRSQRFPFTMLRLGRILTAKEWVVREITLARLGRLMTKHQHELPAYYTPKEIHEQLFHWAEIRGGGIRIEWLELGRATARSIPDYHFTFSRIYPPQSPANNDDDHY